MQSRSGCVWMLIGLALIEGCVHDAPGVAVVANSGQAPVPAPNAHPTFPLPAGKPLRVLFIGNSLTQFNDVPAIVQSLAASVGVRLEYDTCTFGGFNLEDHWSDGRCRNLLKSVRWDYVVLQQGPSSLPENQANLREWSIRWAALIRQAGARPALYMVWPYQKQQDGFRKVIHSYRTAATAAGALVLPAGVAWQEISGQKTSIRLYQADQLHPTAEGSFLAALVITQRLTGAPPKKIPAHLVLSSGNALDLPPHDLAILLATARRACAEKP